MATTVPGSQADVLDQIFAGLKHKNHETRLASAVELQRYVRGLDVPQAMADVSALIFMSFVGFKCCPRDGVGCGEEAMG